MTLFQYLSAIQAKKAINLRSFLALLPSNYKRNWRAIFSSVKVDGQHKNQLTIIDQPCFDAMLAKATPAKNRVEAATLGNSHQHNTSMSYLLVYPNVLAHSVSKHDKLCPQVVLIDGSGLLQEFSVQKTLVIIENQENFFKYPAFLPQLITHTTPLDIVFGQGNGITNTLNSRYLNQYQQILCCFDYDLGGLTMFSSLQKLTTAKVEFVLPSAISLKDETFVNTHFKKTPDKTMHWQKAIQLAERLGLDELAHAFIISKKFMEQEVLLANNTSCLNA